MADSLDVIFKAYDVRGVYPSELDEDTARRIGWAFARRCPARLVAAAQRPRARPGTASAGATRWASRAPARLKRYGVFANPELARARR